MDSLIGPSSKPAGTISYFSSYSANNAVRSSSLTSFILATRSPIPYPFTVQPNLIWASILSPSVTATWRILSPNLATFNTLLSENAAAVLIQLPIRPRISSFSQCPTMTFLFNFNLLPMKPCSLSPCADWLRFMKSMSMDSQGISRLYCVAKCNKGFCNADKPAIHIFDGENVCIHVIIPAHDSFAFASKASLLIESASLTTALNLSL